ncbi:MAG: hypothetical protein ACM3N4_11150 [Nitrososphaerota archaeon]
MFSQWLHLQWAIAPLLAIPLAILLGMRRPTGAIIFSSAGALLIVVITLFRDVSGPIAYDVSRYNILVSFVSQVGSELLLAAWVLSLAHAAQARRWRWFVPLIIVGFLSFDVTFFTGFLIPDLCSQSGLLLGRIDTFACSLPHQALLILLALGQAIGPVVMLIYALRAPGRRVRQLPEGLVVSSLRDGRAPEEITASAD